MHNLADLACMVKVVAPFLGPAQKVDDACLGSMAIYQHAVHFAV